MNPMKIIDKVYGNEEIEEQVLIELINSKEVQRLKNISQMGLPQEYYHIPVYSRYEHSIGVLILLRRLNADLTEQIAGLLHDISHTAFSHVVDWVIGDPEKEDYQDKNHLITIQNSEIPTILKKYNLNYKEISELDKFSLLDQEIPSLCVDRIDYSLRELVEIFDFELIHAILRSLTNFNGQIVFDSSELAYEFAKGYLKLQKEHWAGNQAKIRYYLLAEILKKALEKKIIFLEDFKSTDKEIILKLINSKEANILNDLDKLKKRIFFEESNEGFVAKKKFRYVDPEVLINHEIKKLSEISKEYSIFLEKEREDSKVEKRIKILS
ncbi:MAG: HD domain-containing protein [Candidatus Pacearchaeota archaeon]